MIFSIFGPDPRAPGGDPRAKAAPNSKDRTGGLERGPDRGSSALLADFAFRPGLIRRYSDFGRSFQDSLATGEGMNPYVSRAVMLETMRATLLYRRMDGTTKETIRKVQKYCARVDDLEQRQDLMMLRQNVEATVHSTNKLCLAAEKKKGAFASALPVDKMNRGVNYRNERTSVLSTEQQQLLAHMAYRAWGGMIIDVEAPETMFRKFFGRARLRFLQKRRDAYSAVAKHRQSKTFWRTHCVQMPSQTPSQATSRGAGTSQGGAKKFVNSRRPSVLVKSGGGPLSVLSDLMNGYAAGWKNEQSPADDLAPVGEPKPVLLYAARQLAHQIAQRSSNPDVSYKQLLKQMSELHRLHDLTGSPLASAAQAEEYLETDLLWLQTVLRRSGVVLPNRFLTSMADTVVSELILISIPGGDDRPDEEDGDHDVDSDEDPPGGPRAGANKQPPLRLAARDSVLVEILLKFQETNTRTLEKPSEQAASFWRSDILAQEFEGHVSPHPHQLHDDFIRGVAGVDIQLTRDEDASSPSDDHDDSRPLSKLYQASAARKQQITENLVAFQTVFPLVVKNIVQNQILFLRTKEHLQRLTLFPSKWTPPKDERLYDPYVVQQSTDATLGESSQSSSSQTTSLTAEEMRKRWAESAKAQWTEMVRQSEEALAGTAAGAEATATQKANVAEWRSVKKALKGYGREVVFLGRLMCQEGVVEGLNAGRCVVLDDNVLCVCFLSDGMDFSNGIIILWN